MYTNNSNQSEFSQLCDLATKNNITYSHLINEINYAVLTKLREKKPNLPIGIAVLVDETTGLVRIFSGSEDITPKEFIEELNQVARQTVIQILSTNQTSTEPKTIVKHKSKGIFGKILFWGYNVYFILFNLLAFSSQFSSEDTTSFFETIKTLGFTRTIISLAIFFLPILTILFVLKKQINFKSDNLTQLFYFFEVPLTLFLVASLSLVGRTNWFINLTLVSLLSIPFLLYLYFSESDFPNIFRKGILLVNYLTAILVSYLTIIFTFLWLYYVKDISNLLTDELFYSHSQDYLSFLIPFTIFLLAVGLSLIPYLLSFLLWKMAINNKNKLSQSIGNVESEKHSLISLIIVIAIISVSFIRLPENKLITTLNSFSLTSDYATQEKIVLSLGGQEEKIKELIDKKIGDQQFYLFEDRDIFDNEYISELFNFIAYPLVRPDDYGNLQTNFGNIFGYSYQENIPSENVLMTYRQIKISPENNGLLATINIEEEYKNITTIQQEVVYEFNLPSSATITDLKLGPDLEFSGIIAPKGAAQRTYENELIKRRDPALLEQTGPNQYRLRVFPVPGKNDNTTLKGKRQKVSFSYVVAWDNGYSLPIYTKKTNVFSDASSSINIEKDGKIISQKADVSKIETNDSNILNLCSPQTNSISLSSTNNTVAELVFHANNAKLKSIVCGRPSEWLSEMKNYRTVVIYDTSVRNKQNKQLGNLQKLLNNQTNLLDETTIDFYKFNNSLGKKERLTSSNINKLLKPVYFANQTKVSVLSKIKEQYDLVILIVNKDAPIAQEENFPFAAPTRVYLISDEYLPPFNLEMTSGFWQNNGGVANSVEEAFKSFLIKDNASKIIGANSVTFDKYWSIKYNTSGQDIIGSLSDQKNNLAKIINKGALINFVTNQSREITGNITVMDQLNTAAKQAGIVSPYSSAIALVNEQQLNRLESESKEYDRYQEVQTNNNGLQPIPLFDNFQTSRPIGGIDFSTNETMLSMTSGSSFDNLQGLSYSSRSSSFSKELSFITFTAVIFLIGFIRILIKAIRKKN